jgi:hypothetical protein
MKQAALGAASGTFPAPQFVSAQCELGGTRVGCNTCEKRSL